LDSSSNNVTVVTLPIPPLLYHAWTSSILSTFTFVLSKILSSVWLFGATKVYNNLEKLSKNLGCAFAVFLLLSSTWTRTTTLLSYVCDMYLFGFKLFVQRRRYCICYDYQISFIVVKEFGPIHVFCMIILSFLSMLGYYYLLHF